MATDDRLDETADSSGAWVRIASSVRASKSELADSAETAEADISRREMLRLGSSAAIAAALIGFDDAEAAQKKRAAGSARSKALLFFNTHEFALVDELTELIIPSDDHSAGARAAGVATYIDFRLSESPDEEPRTLWRNGLKLIDSLSQEMHGKQFLQASTEQRIALLTHISQNEMKPEKPEERFFRELKSRTARAYYTSKIGIHAEMEYKGNTYQKEYAGYDAS